jgi:hypothetical protein
MFNKSLTLIAPERHTTEYVTREVHEHRAPTDESVRLLREMEAKAREQIIEAVHVGDATFDCVVHTMRSVEDNTLRLLAIFSLGGKKMTAEHHEYWDQIENGAEAVRALRNKMAETIATEILMPVLANLKIGR